MSVTRSLLEFILNLLRDSDAKAAFVADPEKALADAGLGAVCREDVSDVMSYVVEYHPVAFVGDRGGHGGEGHGGVGGVSQHAGGGPWPGHGGGSGSPGGVVRQVEYVTNNYSYADSHDTVVDRSVNQSVWNEGVLVQRFDDHSVTAADHSVAAGGDITGRVANGEGSVVGEGNRVGNTVHRDDHVDDHSVRGSFTGDTIADHGGIAARATDSDLTTAQHRDGATGDSAPQDAPREFPHSPVLDSPPPESPHPATTALPGHHSWPEGTFPEATHPAFFAPDSAITHTDQHGLLNTTLSPAVTIPVQHHALEVFSPHPEHLPA